MKNKSKIIIVSIFIVILLVLSIKLLTDNANADDYKYTDNIINGVYRNTDDGTITVDSNYVLNYLIIDLKDVMSESQLDKLSSIHKSYTEYNERLESLTKNTTLKECPLFVNTIKEKMETIYGDNVRIDEKNTSNIQMIEKYKNYYDICEDEISYYFIGDGLQSSYQHFLNNNLYLLREAEENFGQGYNSILLKYETKKGIINEKLKNLAVNEDIFNEKHEYKEYTGYCIPERESCSGIFESKSRDELNSLINDMESEIRMLSQVDSDVSYGSFRSERSHFNDKYEEIKMIQGSIEKSNGELSKSLSVPDLKSNWLSITNNEIEFDFNNQKSDKVLFVITKINGINSYDFAILNYTGETPNVGHRVNIKFNGNGGKVQNFNGEYYDEITEPYIVDGQLGRGKFTSLPAATKEGYNFEGWFTEENGGGEITENTEVPYSQTTYYAHWKINEGSGGTTDTPNPPVNNEINIKFNGNEGVVQSSSGKSSVEITKEYTKGGKFAILPTATREGYNFEGWYTEKQNGVQITIDSIVPTTETTYYAHWKINEGSGGTIDTPNPPVNNEINIKFNGNEGVVQSSSGKSSVEITKEYTKGGKFAILPTATREGYNFEGWYTEKQNGVQITIDSIVPTTETIYYAHWKKVQGSGETTDSQSTENNANKDTINSVTGNASISGDKEVINTNNKFNVNKVTDKETYEIKNNNFKDAENIYVIDTELKDKNNSDVKLDNNKLEIKLDIPDGMNQNDNIKVFEIIDGKKVQADFKIDNGKIILSTDHMGRYVVAKYSKNTGNTNDSNIKSDAENNILNPKTGDINLKLIIVGIIVSLVLIIISSIYIIRHKKNKEI